MFLKTIGSVCHTVQCQNSEHHIMTLHYHDNVYFHERTNIFWLLKNRGKMFSLPLMIALLVSPHFTHNWFNHFQGLQLISGLSCTVTIGNWKKRRILILGLWTVHIRHQMIKLRFYQRMVRYSIIFQTNWHQMWLKTLHSKQSML
jgi:hypothetical protein